MEKEDEVETLELPADHPMIHDSTNRMFEQGILPNAEEIARITAGGDVAVVMFEPMFNAAAMARATGWDGQTAVLRLSRRNQTRLATADRVTAQWLGRPRAGTFRMFVIFQGANFLMNFTPGRGYWIEPGSTDAELRATRN